MKKIILLFMTLVVFFAPKIKEVNGIIFIYLDNKIQGIPRPQIYQWFYTAITRAKTGLHIVDDWFIS